MKKLCNNFYRYFIFSVILFTGSISAYSQTKILGVTRYGGTDQFGVIYSLASGNDSIVHDFRGTVSVPTGDFTLAPNGKLYGMASKGGLYDGGAIFEYDPLSGIYTKKYDFPKPSSLTYPRADSVKGYLPVGSLLLASNGKFYGMTEAGGINFGGVLFEYDYTTNTYTKKHDFIYNSPDGFLPTGSLMQASNGKLYGVTRIAPGIFEYDIVNDIYTRKAEIPSVSETFALVQAPNGKLYGASSDGGGTDQGIIFEYDISGTTYTTKYEFNYSSGISPVGALKSAPNGKLYGMTLFGGSGVSKGTIFEYDPANNIFQKKIDFDNSNGATPNGSLCLAPNGKFYGLTSRGGLTDEGVLFEYNYTSNGYAKKFDLNTLAGGKPTGSLTLAANGNFYGLTPAGSSIGIYASFGVIFEYDYNNNVYTRKVNLGSAENGSDVVEALTLAGNGKTYGITESGGTLGQGVIFEYDPASDNYSKKADIGAPLEGDIIEGSLVEAGNGKLYGTRFTPSNPGILFEYDYSTGQLTDKINFTEINGYRPNSRLTQAANGKLYGVTLLGGGLTGNERGVIYEYDYTNNLYTKKIDFDGLNGSNGGHPLVMASNGKMYGVTTFGGTGGNGVIYEYDYNANTYTPKFNFNDTVIGELPGSGLLQATNGKFYGTTTSKDGDDYTGALYEYDNISNTCIRRYQFSDTLHGVLPRGELMQASNGKLYGITNGGGAYKKGVAFEFDYNTGIYTVKKNFRGVDGKAPGGCSLVEVPDAGCIIASTPVLSSNNQSICITNSVNLTIQSGQLNNSINWKWYSGSCGGTPEGTGTGITVSPTVTTTYYARGEGGCGIGLCGSITITVSNPPTAGIVNNTGTTVLNCAVTSISVTASGGLSYSWSNGLGNAAAAIISLPGTYTVTVTGTGGCTSTANITISQDLTIPATPAAISGLTNVCPYIGNNTQLTYSVPADPLATGYQWTLPPAVSFVSGQGTNSIIVTINSNFISIVNRVIKVRAFSTCGNSPERLLYLLAQFPSSAGPISPSSTNVCANIGTNIPVTYTIFRVAGASSYNWTTQSAAISIIHSNGPGINDTTITVTLASNFSGGSISVQAMNDCGTGSTRSFAINRINPPTPGLISGPTNACEYISPNGVAAVYSVSAISGVTFNWLLPVGVTGIAGQGTNSISFIYPAGFTSGTVSVFASNGCGSSPLRSLNISRLVPTAPGTITAIEIQSCPDRIYSYSIATTPANATSVLWTIPSGAILVSGQGTNSITVSYPFTGATGNVTAQAVSNCASSSIRTLVVRLTACPDAPPPPPGPKNSYSKAATLLAGVSSTAFSINAFPNPSTTDFNLRVTASVREKTVVRILDIQGRELKKLYIMPGELLKVGSELKAGSYLIEMKQGEHVKTLRVVKL